MTEQIITNALQRGLQIINEAQTKANRLIEEGEKILAEAQKEANRRLSESSLLKAVHKEAEKIKDKVLKDAELIKLNARAEESLFRYKAAIHLCDNFWKVADWESEKYALFNSKKMQLSEFKYSSIDNYYGTKDRHFSVVIYDAGNPSKMGFIDQNGTEIVPVIYEKDEDAKAEYDKLITNKASHT